MTMFLTDNERALPFHKRPRPCGTANCKRGKARFMRVDESTKRAVYECPKWLGGCGAEITGDVVPGERGGE